MHQIITGDCLIEMARMPAESVDLIMTSPPYAQQRKATYGGIPEAEYAEWFLPRSAEMQRVLRPTGSFILNIKENVVDGSMTTSGTSAMVFLADGLIGYAIPGNTAIISRSRSTSRCIRMRSKFQPNQLLC